MASGVTLVVLRPLSRLAGGVGRGGGAPPCPLSAAARAPSPVLPSAMAIGILQVSVIGASVGAAGGESRTRVQTA